MTKRDDAVRKIILAHLAERFEGVRIMAVNLRHATDADGDDILAINVVFDGKSNQLDPTKTSSVVRHVRPAIEVLGEHAFPVFSFIARSELGKTSPEAA